MALHPLAARFAEVADAYERGRPDYPLAVPGAIAAELGVPGGGRVLDLAAGTGKLTRALVAAGLDVVAIEPQEPLRAILIAAIGPTRVHDGLAEAIPLPEASVAAVTVADGFHWFDQALALAEISRVLRPAHPHFDGPPWQSAVRDAGGWREPWEIEVTFTSGASPARVIDHLTSMSWIAALPAGARAERLGQIRRVIDAGDTPETFPVRARIGLTVRI